MTPSLAMDFNNKFVAHFIAVPSSLPNSHFPFEVYYASWQQCCYELRREHEFHFVSGIVVISCQDHSDGGIIVQCGVSTPLGTLVGRKFAGPLDFEEEGCVFGRRHGSHSHRWSNAWRRSEAGGGKWEELGSFVLAPYIFGRLLTSSVVFCWRFSSFLTLSSFNQWYYIALFRYYILPVKRFDVVVTLLFLAI